MFNTGSDFFNVFMHIAAWAPVIPLCIIFFRKLYRQESFSLLMILCVAGVSVAAVSFLSACKSSGRH